MGRFAAGLEYDGSAFRGWQRQTHAPCVQIPVEQAFSLVADEPVSVVCAGRTDAGVHALCQVIHFDTRAERSNEEWRRGACTNLPETIGVHWVKPVSNEFHARYDAVSRQYVYVIVNRQGPVVLLRNHVCQQTYSLDDKAMHRAAQALVGKHDFSSFRSAGCQAKTATRTLMAISVIRVEEVIYIMVRANAFLQHMVRNIVGALLEIGRGAQDEKWLTWLLAQRDRRQGGVTAVPGGLYLTDIKYPQDYQIQHVDPQTLLFGLLSRRKQNVL